jgi:hypothetical protein
MMRGLHDVQYKYLKRIAKHFDTTVKGLVAEYEDDPFKEEVTPEQPESNVLVLEHQKVITLFKDQARGKYLNELLVEIEDLAPDELDEVAGLLERKVDRLRKRRSPIRPLKDGSSTS